MITFKSIRHTALAAFILAAGFSTGCQKDDEESDAYLEEAAEVVAATYGDDSSSQGVTGQTSELVSFAKDNGSGIYKLQDPDSIITKSGNYSGALGTYTWNYIFNFTYGFSGLNSMTFSYSMNGDYDIPSMSSSDSAKASWTVSGLLATASELVVNGTYSRDGSQQSKVRKKLGLTTQINASIKDMKVNKTTKQVTGGTSDFSINGQVSDGNSFSYKGTVTFLGNKRATLTLGDQTYTIDLNTGKIED